jgi:hypothetical protein
MQVMEPVMGQLQRGEGLLAMDRRRAMQARKLHRAGGHSQGDTVQSFEAVSLDVIEQDAGLAHR